MKGLAVVLLVLLCGCGNGTTQDMMGKIKNAKTGDDIRSALGKPAEYSAMDMPVIGKAETLTYKGSDGEVVVILHNDKVFSVATGGKK